MPGVCDPVQDINPAQGEPALGGPAQEDLQPNPPASASPSDLPYDPAYSNAVTTKRLPDGRIEIRFCTREAALHFSSENRAAADASAETFK